MPSKMKTVKAACGLPPTSIKSKRGVRRTTRSLENGRARSQSGSSRTKAAQTASRQNAMRCRGGTPCVLRRVVAAESFDASTSLSEWPRLHGRSSVPNPRRNATPDFVDFLAIEVSRFVGLAIRSVVVDFAP